jgi:heme-degrading monooxygenase HmoA
MPASDFAPLPAPPYYAVIFTAQRAPGDHGYSAMASPGCLGMESTRNEGGFGITVSYWRDEAAILSWKADAQHLVAQQLGQDRWYTDYTLRVAKVERHYSGPEGRDPVRA